MQLIDNEKRYVLESALPLLQAKIDKLNEKLARSKSPPIEMVITDPAVKKFSGPSGTAVLPVVQVELSRELLAPTGNYRVLAETKIDTKTQFMEHKTYEKLSKEQDEKIRLAESPCLCDHCGTNRLRIFIYSLETPNGVMRVGSGCVDDFTGFDFKVWHKAYEKAVEAINFFTEIDFKAVEQHAILPVTEFLCEAIAEIKANGYKTFQVDGYSTARDAFFSLSESLDAVQSGEKRYTGDIREKAMKIKEFLLSTALDSAKRDNDYYANLRGLIEFGRLTVNQCSLLASAIPTYEREIAKTKVVKAGAELANEHFGDLSDGKKPRLPLKNLRVDSAWPRKGYYGLTTKITMFDDKNRMFVWEAAGQVDIDVGDTVHLVGTISDHTTWHSKKYGKDMCENKLQRCKFHTLEEINDLIEKADKKASKQAKKSDSGQSLSM